MNARPKRRGRLSCRAVLALLTVALTVLVAACGKGRTSEGPATAGVETWTTPGSTTAELEGSGTQPGSEAQPGAAAPSAPMRLAIVADCEGPLVGIYEPVVAAIQAAFARHAGGVPAGPHPTDGMTGIVAGGRPIEIVGYGCGDGSAEGTAAEVTRLIEEHDPEVVIGPTSAEGGLAVAALAADHAETIFLDPGTGAQETTLAFRAPNVFRFGPDAAQTTAGLGDYATTALNWRSVALLGEDSLTGYTTLAGFVAEFCALGGVVETRIWAPPGETEFGPYVAELPVEVDGYVVGLRGAELAAFLETFERLAGKVDPHRFLGTSAWLDRETLDAVGDHLLGAVASMPTPGGATGYGATVRYGRLIEEVYPQVETEPSSLVAGAFNAATALVVALEETGGAMGAPLREALSEIRLDTAYGPLELDENRQAIHDNYLVRIVPAKRGGVKMKTILRVPSVEQDFGGVFSAVFPPPDRANPACRAADPPPWVGEAKPVRR